MRKVQNDDVTLIVSDIERHKLWRELEELFAASSIGTTPGYYSGVDIKDKYPKVWELHCTLSKRNL